ncbi:lycopene cyclase family protein [Kitasatospora terrestris]|uniref:Lycopene cyclase family protein n=1 Tax=Kitasatospora terrestris TaxID=258051 RepID=A0ABP9DFD5_9ACTN
MTAALPVAKPSVVVIGAGAAGLSLAHWLTGRGNASGTPVEVTVVEAADERVRSAARTWCFWDDWPGEYEEAVAAQWSRLRVTGPDGEVVGIATDPLRYRMVRSEALEALLHERLVARSGVRLLRATVEEVFPEPDGSRGARVVARDAAGRTVTLSGRYVFDSRPATRLPPARTTLLQHFRGWFVRTDRPRFDPQCAHLMDFRVPQPRRGLAFGYVLPLDVDRALVEFTEFSRRPLTASGYEDALDHYTRRVLGLGGFRVEDVEQGVIPMTDGRFVRRVSRDHYRIGAAGGATRPSTGYTFAAIQRQSRDIASALGRGQDHDLVAAAYGRRALAMDAVLLRALDTGRIDGPRFFTELFRRTPGDLLLRFLDGRTTVAEDVRIGLRCPVGPMLRCAAELPFVRRRSAGRVARSGSAERSADR